jgi:hypothetical protein
MVPLMNKPSVAVLLDVLDFWAIFLFVLVTVMVVEFVVVVMFTLVVVVVVGNCRTFAGTGHG